MKKIYVAILFLISLIFAASAFANVDINGYQYVLVPDSNNDSYNSAVIIRVCNKLFVELKDASLNKFIVDYPGVDGKIIVFSGAIGKVENNPKIQIDYKKNVFR